MSYRKNSRVNNATDNTGNNSNNVNNPHNNYKINNYNTNNNKNNNYKNRHSYNNRYKSSNYPNGRYKYAKRSYSENKNINHINIEHTNTYDSLHNENEINKQYDDINKNNNVPSKPIKYDSFNKDKYYKRNNNMYYDKIKSDKSYIATRIAVGIALCRDNPNTKKKEILLVRKRYSYGLPDFTRSSYINIQGKSQRDKLALETRKRIESNKNLEHLSIGERKRRVKGMYINNYCQELINNMTPDEKLILKSLNFDMIYYKMWMHKFKTPVYYNAKFIFEKTFMVDNGEKLHKMINKSRNGKLVWEIPKGKKLNKNEPDLICAIREFTEETNIIKKMYKIYPEICREHSFIEAGTKYVNRYYLAYTRQIFEPEILMSNIEQTNEISEIQWMDLDAVKAVCGDHLHKFVKNIFRTATNKLKNKI